MINIAELLKDVPKGMKLYSPLFGEVEYCYIGGADRRIWVCTKASMRMFSKDGRYCFTHDGNTIESTECLLFPNEDCRTWEGWKLPVESKFKFKVGDWIVKKDGTTFYGGNYAEQVTLIEGDGFLKCIWFSSGTWLRENDIRLWSHEDARDGDVLVTTKIRSCPFIYRKTDAKNNLAYYYAGIDGDGNFCEGCLKRTLSHFGPVANVAPATKEQCELLFKKMKEAGYEWDADKKELRKIKPHYDIANFNPFDKVLVRQNDSSTWGVSFFGLYSGLFMCCTNVWFEQCIPFNDDTKHLLGTTEMCDEQYINW